MVPVVVPHYPTTAFTASNRQRVVVLDGGHDGSDELEEHQQVVLDFWKLSSRREDAVDESLHRRRVFARVDGRGEPGAWLGARVRVRGRVRGRGRGRGRVTARARVRVRARVLRAALRACHGL